MKSPTKPLALLFALALPVLPVFVTGCDRTVSKNEKTDVGSDGTVKQKETTVTEKSDGTVEKKEETKKTTPANP